MISKDYELNDLVVMKKQHPCGANKWKIIRMGADIRIKCMNCNRSIMMTRGDFNRKLKNIITDDE
ncbi:DUF951 domain-containing protein [Haloplasma contractile]|uniref:DUF951 domain-containing protein n=1 Tax=Haloplasma contractile SSD-17B TaxID=1033810 RepID=F7PT34_9MOLU|nr:DUF951 domain-containing protein [Haloplasma contractile]ERJ12554.1 hypothetical protein HLPCO_001540 [Haloplasma contractile SSD-17B]